MTELAIPGTLLTMNKMRRIHFHTRNAHDEEWRSSAAGLAREVHLRHFDRATITVTPHQAKGTLADPGAHYPSVKAAIDGLVDAGVLDDDTGLFLAGITMLPVVKCKGYDWLSIVITEAIEESEPA